MTNLAGTRPMFDKGKRKKLLFYRKVKRNQKLSNKFHKI